MTGSLQELVKRIMSAVFLGSSPASSQRAQIRKEEDYDIQQGQKINLDATLFSDFCLPAGFAIINLSYEDGGSFSIVGSSPPKDYEKGLLAGNLWGTPNVVWLVKQLIGSRGLLIDVGANIGCVSVPIAMAGHDVLAVELIPENCLKLQLIRLYSRLENLHVFHAAVSSSEGGVEFGGAEAWGMIGHGTQAAASFRLDTIFKLSEFGRAKPFGQPVVIKIDVEGHELAVLEGASTLIEHFRPAIIFESIQDADDNSHSTALRCKELLCRLGYKLYLQYGSVLAPKLATDLQEGLVSDFLALHTDQANTISSLDVRPLTLEERLGIIRQDANEESQRHQNHAKAASRRIHEEAA